jgi:TonB family protein
VVALQPPPPPPPPPPPKEQPPEPEKIQTETPTPAPSAPQKAAPQNLTIAGPAQAGGDAFGIGAGKGGGGVVGGTGDGGMGGGAGGAFAEGAYYRYASAFIQQAVQTDDRVTRSVFSLDVRLWIDGAGKISGASIIKTSGDAKLDRQVISVLEGMRHLEEPPPASMKFPLKVTIRGRRA